jgi:transposase
MGQLHKRFSDEQVAFLFQAYEQGLMSRKEVQETLDIGRTRFFDLWRVFRQAPEAFSISYQRAPFKRLSPEAEMVIEQELLREKSLIDDPDLPISSYNYSAVRDRLQKQGIDISVNTVIDRAKKLGCHQPRRRRKVHDREVLTASVGALIQHDASTHRWSPFAQEKWTLITSIDDYSRMILFADFFASETTWAHIQATQAVIETFGLPLRYYVDSLRVFRFVQGRDSFPGLSVQDRLAQARAPDR